MTHRLEMRDIEQRGDIVLAAGEVIVDAQDVVAFADKAFAQMRPKKPGAASNKDALSDRGSSGIL